MMTQIKLYKSASGATGLRMVYNAWPANKYRGWVSSSYMFGSSEKATALETLDLENDVKTLHICMDDGL